MSDIGDPLWSPIDASNNAQPPNGWPEGQFPSTVNNSARAGMGGVKRSWQRSNSTQTTTGTSTAYVLTYPAAETALYDGEETSFIVHATCGASPTLNRDALGAYPLRKYINGAYTAVAADDLTAGQVLRVRYNAGGGTPTYDIVNANGTGANLYAGTAPFNLVQLDASGALPNLPGIFQTGMRIATSLPTAPTGWIVANGLTIGDASSNATNRANADTQALFFGYYNGGTDATHPLLTSAGAATTRAAQGTASVAYAAHCQITVPNYIDRLSIGAGGTFAPTVGVTGGASTQTLIAANLPPHPHDNAGGPTSVLGGSGGGSTLFGAPGGQNTGNGPGTSTPFSIMNPFIGDTPIIKL